MLKNKINESCRIVIGVSVKTSLNGAVAKSSANELVGTGFASRYHLQPTAGF